MPYGFYIFVRFAAMVGFVLLAIDYNKKKQDSLAITFGVLAVLFQPFIKLALGRGLWVIIDVIVAILLIVLFSKNKK